MMTLEERRKYQKDWREKNSDYYKEHQKEWRKNHPNYSKDYYQDLKEGKKKTKITRFQMLINLIKGGK